jgi:hypothetical protein
VEQYFEKYGIKFIDILGDEEIIHWGEGDIKIVGCSLLNEANEESIILEWGEKIKVIMLARTFKDVDCEHIGFGFSFRDRNGLDIIVSTTIEEGREFGPLATGDEVLITYELENILAPGEYLLTFQSEDRTYYMPKYFDFVENAKIFKVVANKRFFSLTQPKIDQKIKINKN